MTDQPRSDDDDPLHERFLKAQSEAEFHALFESTADFIWTVDSERFSFVTSNPAFRNYILARYGIALRRGMLPRDCLPADRAKIWIAYYERARGEGRFEIDHESAEPKENFHISFSLLKDADGREFGISVHCRNVTNHKKMEAALRETDELFFHAFAYASIGKALVHPTGRWLKVNPSICQLLGYTAEELASTTWQQITHPEDISLDQRYVDQMLRGEIQRYQIEKRYIHKSGRVIWALLSVSLVCDDRGVPLYFVSQIQDITERRQAETALRNSEGELRSFILNAPVGIVRSSISEDRLLTANPAFVQMMGYSSEDEVSRLRLSTDLYLNAEERPRIVESLRNTGEFRGIEVAGRRKDGKSVLLRLSGRMRAGEGGGPGDMLDIIVEDVTQHRNLEGQLRQSQKMEAIGLLAGGISHDFNNLLSIILGNVSLVLDETTPETPEHTHSTAILEATRRAADLIRQLLTFSRKQVLRATPLDLNSIITELGRLIRRLVGNDMNIHFELDPNIGCVRADRGQIEQILMNLATNARDAMPHGGEFTLRTEDVELELEHVAMYPYVKPGSYVRLRVCDTGEGMTQEIQAHIFEPFFTTKPTGHGTGLGLATVYGIIKQNNGYIWVSSEPGKGSTFDIYFPRLHGSFDEEYAADTAAQTSSYLA